MYPLINMHHPISAVVDSGAQKHLPGDRIVYRDAEYTFAYNGSNSAITANKLCDFISGSSGYSVVVSGATTVRPVGVCVHTTVATGQYFWMLTDGVCPRVSLTGPTAANFGYLYPGAAGQLSPTAPTGVGTAALGGYVGAVARAMEEIASGSTSGKVYFYKV